MNKPALISDLFFSDRQAHAVALLLILALGFLGCDMFPMTASASGQSAATAAVAVEPTETVIVRNLAQPGAMEVENAGPDVDLAWKSVIQQEIGGQWQALPVEFELVEKCGTPKKTSCLHLPHGATVRPVPWTGYSCASQCNQACRANVYLGPGVFRFVVTSCDGKQKWQGPGFRLGEYRPAR